MPLSYEQHQLCDVGEVDELLLQQLFILQFLVLFLAHTNKGEIDPSFLCLTMADFFFPSNLK